MSDQTFTEAPASATMRIEYRGYDILFTLRDSTGAELLKKLEGAITHFDKLGIKPAPQYAGKPSAAANGNTPNCPEHNTPMKQGKKGWYCPMVVTEVQGRKIYCNHTA